MVEKLLARAILAALAEDGPALLKVLETAAAFLAPPRQNGVSGSTPEQARVKKALTLPLEGLDLVDPVNRSLSRFRVALGHVRALTKEVSLDRHGGTAADPGSTVRSKRVPGHHDCVAVDPGFTAGCPSHRDAGTAAARSVDADDEWLRIRALLRLEETAGAAAAAGAKAGGIRGANLGAGSVVPPTASAKANTEFGALVEEEHQDGTPLAPKKRRRGRQHHGSARWTCR